MRLNAKVCIYCGYYGTMVKDSRIHPIDDILYRRRECPKCHKAYTTAEMPIGARGYRLVRKAVENLD